MTTRVVMLAGLPGSGKSRLADRLCDGFALARIDRDQLRRELYLAPTYSADEKDTLNREVLRRLEQYCMRDASCLIDGMTFSRKGERDAVRSVASRHGCRSICFWLDCPVEIAAARVMAQRHAAADRNEALVREVAERFEPPSDGVRLDATLPTDELLRRVNEVLG